MIVQNVYVIVAFLSGLNFISLHGSYDIENQKEFKKLERSLHKKITRIVKKGTDLYNVMHGIDQKEDTYQIQVKKNDIEYAVLSACKDFTGRLPRHYIHLATLRNSLDYLSELDKNLQNILSVLQSDELTSDKLASTQNLLRIFVSEDQAKKLLEKKIQQCQSTKLSIHPNDKVIENIIKKRKTVKHNDSCHETSAEYGKRLALAIQKKRLATQPLCKSLGLFV